MSPTETKWVQVRPLPLPPILLSNFNWPYRYIYISKVGGLDWTNREIVSFRSCLRAQLYARSEWISKLIWIPFSFSLLLPRFLPFSLGRSGVPFPLRYMRSTESKWDQVSPSEFKWDQVNPSESIEVKCGQVSPSELKWDQVSPSESKWVQVRSSESKWTQIRSTESKWVQVRSIESKWTQVRSSESSWDQVSPSEFKWDPSPSPQSSYPTLVGLIGIYIYVYIWHVVMAIQYIYIYVFI